MCKPLHTRAATLSLLIFVIVDLINNAAVAQNLSSEVDQTFKELDEKEAQIYNDTESTTAPSSSPNTSSYFENDTQSHSLNQSDTPTAQMTVDIQKRRENVRIREKGSSSNSNSEQHLHRSSSNTTTLSKEKDEVPDYVDGPKTAANIKKAVVTGKREGEDSFEEIKIEEVSEEDHITPMLKKSSQMDRRGESKPYSFEPGKSSGNRRTTNLYKSPNDKMSTASFSSGWNTLYYKG